MQVEWEKTIAVGEGRIRVKLQLLTQNFYLRLEDLMSEQIITGDVRSLGMKLGRIKEAIITNGIGWTKVSRKEQKKIMHISHPEINGGQEFEWEITDFEHPLAEPREEWDIKQPPLLTPNDGDFMATLADALAGAVAEGNPGLKAGKYSGIVNLFVKTEEVEDEDSEADLVDPTKSEERTPAPPAEDISTSEPSSISEPLQVQ